MVGSQKPPATAEETYTSISTQRLVREADAMLSGDLDTEEIHRHLSELAEHGDTLTQEQRDQLDELARLMSADPENEDAAAVLSRPGSFSLTPGDDHMTLYLTVNPPMGGGEAVTFDQVHETLRGRGIVHGVDVEAIQKAVATACDHEQAENVPIVFGRLPQAGTPAKVQLYARRRADAEPEPIDLQQLSREEQGLLLCEPGDVVLKRIPPRPGRRGFDALGGLLEPPQMEDPRVEVGDNVEERGEAYLAAVAGVVRFDGQRLEVRRMLVIDRDLSGKSDPIQFDGEVHIRGGVRYGAHVRASGDIRIEGSVEAAAIESTQGDVILKHGVAGQNKALIKAAGDITTRFAENATLMANRSVIVQTGALHSRLVAGQSVFVSRGRGQVIGGAVMAGALVEVKQAGSPSGVHTELRVGLGLEVMHALARIDQKLQQLRTKRDEFCELADRLRRTVGDPANLKPEEKQVYLRLRQFQLSLETRIRNEQQQREELLTDAARQTDGRIDILDTLMPRVVVTIGDAEEPITDTQRRVRITYDAAQQQLKFGPLR